MTDPTTLHTLTITAPDKPIAFEGSWGRTGYDLGDFTSSVTCIPGGCHGWQECREDHAGFDPEDEESPAFDLIEDDEIEIHGVIHTWRYGWGWTVEFPGCVVAANDAVHEYAEEILQEYGPGAYLVDDDWDDSSLTLDAVGLADGSPLPEPGWAARNATSEAPETTTQGEHA